ncbi:MAG: hypothetical protein KA154_09755 [Gemmatimonadaceae bacterium]|nr:hypothetical protein [Gemmatimonadaceae bacterium]MCC6430189.1 thiol oxidoreductase [Gemmatimonadaceae bacterium]
MSLLTPRLSRAAAALCLLAALAACGGPLLPDAPDDTLTLEGPFDGLTGAQASAHAFGDGEFARHFNPGTGLGPLFVASSCSSCHVADGRGHPVFNITRFGRPGPDGFDSMEADGGPQLQHRAVAGHLAEALPSVFHRTAQFMAPAVSGLGLLEAVPDSTLLALADPDDLDGDGISGTLSLVAPTPFVDAVLAHGGSPSHEQRARRTLVNGQYIGRFGKKARAIDLTHQTVVAYSQDMGITSDLIPQELHSGRSGGIVADAVPDPEAPGSVVDAVVFYLRTLRAPPRRSATSADVASGDSLFVRIGCSSCHTPTLRTGRSSIAPLDRVVFQPFTDLLLHDMGPELDDGYTEGNATTSEWRTAPLWGVGIAERAQGGTPFYLHDGRAHSLRDAIRFHGGEASRSRAAFNALSPAQQEQLLAYLRSL